MVGYKFIHSVMIPLVGRYNKWTHFWVNESGVEERACAGPCEHAQ